MTLPSLGIEYLNWLRSLTRKIIANAFFQLTSGILVFLFSQLCTVLAFFLPLKVIIMVGTEGIPRYLRFFVDEGNKNDFITLFAVLAIGFYIASLLCDVLLGKLSDLSVQRILASTKKVKLFEQQAEFAKDVFIRVVRTWSTAFMVVAGFAVGFWLEWRIFAALSLVMAIEFFLLSLIWGYCQKPEHAKSRAHFLENQPSILKALSAINFFVGFAVLFYLFIIGAVANFIIGILMILLIRQVLQRMLVAINDAVFLSQQRPKIIGIFYTHAQFEQGKHHVAITFEERLKPESRSELLTILTTGNEDLTALEWGWIDSGEKGTALYTAVAVNNRQYWLKLYPANKEAAFEQSRVTLQALQTGQINHAPVLLDQGFKSGLHYILLATQIPKKLDARTRKKALNKWMVETWKAPPPSIIASMLERSLPPLSKRLSHSKLSKLTLATHNQEEQRLVARLLEHEETIVNFINSSPKFLRNNDLSELNVIYLGDGRFSFLSWHKVSVDPVCSDIRLKQLGKLFKPTEIAEQLRSERSDCADLSASDIKRIVYLSTLDQLLTKGHYRAAFELVTPILRLFDE